MFDLFGRKRRIAQLEESLEQQARLTNIAIEGWKEQAAQLRGIKTDLAVYNRAIGRIVAKLDPAFLDDPLNPEVRRKSDLIGDEVIRRLRGEVIASNPEGAQ